jgi:hypothetical protein
MLARVREMEVLVRWARVHWNELREPLGFTREQPPVATTISRTLALCTVADVQAVFLTWLQTCGAELPAEGVVAVDGKTAKQAIDSNGRPLHMLNAFVHELQITIGQWSVGAEKTNEPMVLRRRLEELIANFPILKLLTGDAIFAQRPLSGECGEVTDCRRLAGIDAGLWNIIRVWHTLPEQIRKEVEAICLQPVSRDISK